MQHIPFFVALARSLLGTLLICSYYSYDSNQYNLLRRVLPLLFNKLSPIRTIHNHAYTLFLAWDYLNLNWHITKLFFLCSWLQHNLTGRICSLLLLLLGMHSFVADHVFIFASPPGDITAKIYSHTPFGKSTRLCYVIAKSYSQRFRLKTHNRNTEIITAVNITMLKANGSCWYGKVTFMP